MSWNLPPGCTDADIDRAINGDEEPDMGRLTPILHAADEPETSVIEPVRLGGWDAAAEAARVQAAEAPPAKLGADALISVHEQHVNEVVEFAIELIDRNIAKLEQLKERIKLQGSQVTGRARAFIKMVDEGLKSAEELNDVVKKVEGLL